MITSLTRRADYPGAGLTGPYSFTFRIFDPTDLEVSFEDTVGNVSTLGYISDFTLEGVAIGNDPFGAGGFLTLITPLAIGETLTILRKPEQTQPRSFTNGGPYFPKNHEEAFDRLTMIIQGMQDEVDRSIKQNVTDGNGTSLVLPPAASLQLIGWDADGTQLANFANDFKEATTDRFVNGVGFTTGVTVELTLAAAPGTAANALVFFDGVEQDHSKWSLNGTTITFNAAIVATAVEVAYRRTIDVSAMVGANQKDAVQFGAVGDGVADDTTAIQNLWNWSAATGGWGVIRGPKTYIVDNLIVRDGMQIFIDRNAIIKHKSGSVNHMVTLPQGVVQRVKLSGGKWRGNLNAGKHGFYLRAQPILVDGAIQGGIWYSFFDEIDVQDFLGEQFWLHGAGNFTGPNQFLVFNNPRIINGSLTKRALRMSGQVGQVEFNGGHIDGPGRSLGAENIKIERSVDYLTGVQDTDLAPYTINFRGTTSQSCVRVATVERASNVFFDAAHFEECPEGIHGDVSVVNLRVVGCQFNNIGHRDNNDGSGWAVKCAGGSTIVRDNTFLSSSDAVAPDTHYINAVAPPDFGLRLEGRHYDSTGIRTDGISVQRGAATAMLEIGGFTQVAFQTSATAITGLLTKSAPGTVIHILASDGPLFFDVDNAAAISAGAVPITLSPFGIPLVLNRDAIATFVLDELGGSVFARLISMSQPMGQIRPPSAFVSASGNVTGRGGTELIDATLGAIVRTLPTVSPAVPSGYRITFKKMDGSANTVTIVGAEQGSNYILNNGNSWVEVEWTGVNWVVVAFGTTSSVAQSDIVTTAATNVGPYGFATQAQADALVQAVNRLLAMGRRANWIT